MASIIEYYEVSYDDGFSLSGPAVCARFLTLSAAEEYANLAGCRYVNKTKRKITVFDTVEEAEIQKREDIRKSALNKLTSEERLALGV